MSNLTFRQLREANLARLPLFKNSIGEPAHHEPDGSDWSLSDWMNAVHGETGEAANIIKKVRRGDLSLDAARPKLADELADAQTYLDLLAHRAGIDLGEATLKKWNEVSQRIGIDLRLADSYLAQYVAEPVPAPRPRFEIRGIWLITEADRDERINLGQVCAYSRGGDGVAFRISGSAAPFIVRFDQREGEKFGAGARELAAALDAYFFNGGNAHA